MSDAFSKIHQYTAIHEGGKVDDPKDPGGRTAYGVTQRVYSAYRINKGLSDKDVWDISQEEVEDIYRKQYFDKIMGDDLPAGVNYSVYDYAVNSGVSRAVRELQKLVHVKADGIMGQMTLAAVRGNNDIVGLIVQYNENRLAFMKRLKIWPRFKNGWTRRVMGDMMGHQPGEDSGVIDRSVKMYLGDFEEITPPVAPALGKAEEETMKMSGRAAENMKDPKTILTGAIAATPPLLTAASQTEGPLLWAISACLVIAVVVIAVLMLRKK